MGRKRVLFLLTIGNIDAVDRRLQEINLEPRSISTPPKVTGLPISAV
jgi:hypothetical protein